MSFLPAARLPAKMGTSATGNSVASTRALNEHEAKAQKRQLELLADDCKRVCTADYSRAFSNLQEAVDRLLPFHILGAPTPEEADLEQALNQPGAELLNSRRDAWSEHVLHQTQEVVKRTEAIQQRFNRLDGQYSNRHTQLMPEERVILEKWLLLEARELLEADKRKPVDYVSSDAGSDEETISPSKAADAALIEQQPMQPVIAVEQSPAGELPLEAAGAVLHPVEGEEGEDEEEGEEEEGEEEDEEGEEEEGEGEEEMEGEEGEEGEDWDEGEGEDEAEVDEDEEDDEAGEQDGGEDEGEGEHEDGEDDDDDDDDMS